MLSASDISHAIKTVPDLSANHKSKWDLVYPVVAEAFELDEQQTYLTYINKPGNTQVRLTKQIAGSWTSVSQLASAVTRIRSQLVTQTRLNNCSEATEKSKVCCAPL